MTDQKKIIKTSTRLPADLHDQLTKIAEEQGRAFNNFVVNVLRDYVKRGEWLYDRESDDGK